MPTSSRQNLKQMEVIVMFEPHRLQQDLLQTAYKYLVPQSRRRLPRSQTVAMASQVHPCDLHTERNRS
jgi:hypothetical protein